MKTLATNTIELVFAELILDYLTETQTGFADAAVAKHLMDIVKDPEMPAIVVAVKEEGSKNSARRTLVVNPHLMTWARSEQAGAAEVAQQTTQDEANQILAALDRRLRDGAAFQAWLDEQPEERRDGWSILKIVHEGVLSPGRKDERTIVYALEMRVHLVVGRVVS